MTVHAPQPKPVATTCPYCGVGCGVIAGAGDDGRVTIAGDPGHPANRGKLCVKGSTLGETLSLDDRLLHPMMRSPSGGLERVSWETALDGGVRDRIHGVDGLPGERGGDGGAGGPVAGGPLAGGFLHQNGGQSVEHDPD